MNDTISKIGVEGVKRILNHYDMLNPKKKTTSPKEPTVFVEDSKWIRAKHSGMFKAKIPINSKVAIDSILGQITDPYGRIHYDIKSTIEGYIINVNEASLVYQGDALFHITTKLKT